jgi:hypothetical protein
MTFARFGCGVMERFNGGRTGPVARPPGEAERAKLARRDGRTASGWIRQAYDAAKVARSAIVTADDRLAAARAPSADAPAYQEGLASQISTPHPVHQRGAEPRLTAHRYAIRYFDLERSRPAPRNDEGLCRRRDQSTGSFAALR